MAFFKRKPPQSKTGAGDKAEAADKTALTPIVTLIAADLALRTGDRLVRRGIERGLLNGKAAKTSRVIRGRTLKETVIGTVLAEVAPDAIVGGGLVAKALRDRRRARKVADQD